MKNIYTAVVKKADDWWVGWIEEVPGVNLWLPEALVNEGIFYRMRSRRGLRVRPGMRPRLATGRPSTSLRSPVKSMGLAPLI